MSTSRKKTAAKPTAGKHVKAAVKRLTAVTKIMEDRNHTDLMGSSLYHRAGELYTAYCEAVGGKAHDGQPLPAWSDFYNDDTKRKQVRAWMFVASQVGEREDEIMASASSALSGADEARRETHRFREALREVKSLLPALSRESEDITILRAKVGTLEMIARIGHEAPEKPSMLRGINLPEIVQRLQGVLCSVRLSPEADTAPDCVGR
jgi:hypothetical protein